MIQAIRCGRRSGCGRASAPTACSPSSPHPDQEAGHPRYGTGRQPIAVASESIDQPGTYCFPPIAMLVTGAAWLMLAMVEKTWTDMGGACDDLRELVLPVLHEHGLNGHKTIGRALGRPPTLFRQLASYLARPNLTNDLSTTSWPALEPAQGPNGARQGAAHPGRPGSLRGTLRRSGDQHPHRGHTTSYNQRNDLPRSR